MEGCSKDNYPPQVTLKVFRGEWPDLENTNEQIGSTLEYDDSFNQPLMVEEGSYNAKDNFIITVKYDW